jgi:hypothetical protein
MTLSERDENSGRPRSVFPFAIGEDSRVGRSVACGHSGLPSGMGLRHGRAVRSQGLRANSQTFIAPEESGVHLMLRGIPGFGVNNTLSHIRRLTVQPILKLTENPLLASDLPD